LCPDRDHDHDHRGEKQRCAHRAQQAGAVEAADERQVSRVVGRYGRLDLLCLDELGYVQIDPPASSSVRCVT
jgi:hypothetical protein